MFSCEGMFAIMIRRTIIRILMFNRTIFTDVVQGIIIGGVLAFITAQIIMNAYVTTVNGWTTIFGCGEPSIGTASTIAPVSWKATAISRPPTILQSRYSSLSQAKSVNK
jgi:ABC-type xylose transport system permease subunit